MIHLSLQNTKMQKTVDIGACKVEYETDAPAVPKPAAIQSSNYVDDEEDYEPEVQQSVANTSNTSEKDDSDTFPILPQTECERYETLNKLLDCDNKKSNKKKLKAVVKKVPSQIQQVTQPPAQQQSQQVTQPIAQSQIQQVTQPIAQSQIQQVTQPIAQQKIQKVTQPPVQSNPPTLICVDQIQSSQQPTLDNQNPQGSQQYTINNQDNQQTKKNNIATPSSQTSSITSNTENECIPVGSLADSTLDKIAEQCLVDLPTDSITDGRPSYFSNKSAFQEKDASKKSEIPPDLALLECRQKNK
ncbi:hypothetical protein EDEG_01866 [Edhazardia aedis USNM 41457]|uniref:Uncharacterized protein n=1 Tax=Edhazardia aedis (strain USNM 41457) TaxID=1003232 RepID=J9DML6_EDHAE|nr:hypothetical protein EDEG_01866 [Edhazardia aedis USNM 41457]|eukprot:EJW03840.1 hypothetical protein EDEG_01866 [Edhazardia aedis USNM 41457]